MEIIKEDSQSQVKDLCVEILLQIKHILDSEYAYEALYKFEEMISTLPNLRVNLIMSGKTPKNIKENNQNFEKEYRANLNRIKSSISVGMQSKSPLKLTYKNSRKFNASKKRSSKRGFRSTKNTANIYGEKPTESSFNKRKRSNNRIDRLENESGSDYNSSDGKIHDDYEKPEDKYPQKVKFFGDLEDRNAEKIFKNKKSLEKNKGRDEEVDKQAQKRLISENNQLFINNYKKINQKEMGKNIKKDHSKSKKS